MACCGASVEGPLLMKVLVCECVLDDMSVWGATWAFLGPVRGDYEGGSLLRRACRGKTVWAFCQDLGRLDPSSFENLLILCNSNL